jgi:PAS domain-containing protein
MIRDKDPNPADAGRLLDREVLFDVLLSTVVDGILAIDVTGRILLCSNACARLFGSGPARRSICLKAALASSQPRPPFVLPFGCRSPSFAHQDRYPFEFLWITSGAPRWPRR